MKLFVLVILLVCPSLFLGQAATPTTAEQEGATRPQAKPTRAKMPYTMVANALLTNVVPVYPQEARDKKIQGPVTVHVVIGTDGVVKEANAVSGDPLLIRPAVEAVRQWTYRPTLLNGEAIEVDTEIPITFKLKGKKPKKEKATMEVYGFVA